MTLKTRWIHFKLRWFGNIEFEKNGKKLIPCKKCGKYFISLLYNSPDVGYSYDAECKECE